MGIVLHIAYRQTQHDICIYYARTNKFHAIKEKRERMREREKTIGQLGLKKITDATVQCYEDLYLSSVQLTSNNSEKKLVRLGMMNT